MISFRKVSEEEIVRRLDDFHRLLFEGAFNYAKSFSSDKIHVIDNIDVNKDKDKDGEKDRRSVLPSFDLPAT